jgi:hypothetical protein
MTGISLAGIKTGIFVANTTPSKIVPPIADLN